MIADGFIADDRLISLSKDLKGSRTAKFLSHAGEPAGDFTLRSPYW